MKTKYLRKIKVSPIILLQAIIVAIAGFFAWYIHELNLTRAFLDQNAHLNLSRQVLDSLTPGISQIGFWPPLLHFLLVPWIAIEGLYRTGIAASFALIPVLLMGVYYLYKIIFDLTKKRDLAILAGVLFALNPYVLYYSLTPMMEVLFLSLLAATAYYTLDWIKSESIISLSLVGLLTTLTTLSRFEGFILIPIILALVYFTLRQKKKTYHEIESCLIIYGITASLGAFFTLAYGFAYGGHPLTFLQGQWSARAQQNDFNLPAQYNVLLSFKYIFSAAKYMIGPVLMIASGAGTVVLLFWRSKEKTLWLWLSLILASPFLLHWLMLFVGNTVIYVPELPPFNDFFNERYGLSLSLFTIVSSVALMFFLDKIRLKRWPTIRRIISDVTYVTIIAGALIFTYSVSFFHPFEIIKKSAQEYPSQKATAAALKQNYDGGKILLTRALHDFTIIDSGIDIQNFIHESNYRYFEQALEQPWFFSRYVLMIKPEYEIYTNQQLSNDLVTLKWNRSEDFLKYYSLIYENQGSSLYKIKADVVTEYARQNNLNEKKLPSLNTGLRKWDPKTALQEARLVETLSNK